MKYELFVIGTGGTGTYFIKEIARFLASKRRTSVTKIHLFDGDIVERKNLSRQCFCEEDIGRNKAVVMQEVLSATYPELKIYAHPEYVLDIAQILTVAKNTPLIISCVDNHACRLLLEQIFEELDTCFLFDSGNEFITGEAVFAYKVNGETIGPVRSHYFPEIKEGDLRSVDEFSCEELNNAAPQHIFTNMVAGWHLCSAVANLLEDKYTPGMTIFNSLAYSSQFIPYRRQEG